MAGSVIPSAVFPAVRIAVLRITVRRDRFDFVFKAIWLCRVSGVHFEFGCCMITTIGRVFTVLVAIASVAFMAFAISRWATIPDWPTEARKLEDFSLTRTEGETPSWSATTRRTGEAVATSTNIAQVLEAMYKRAAQDRQTELSELQQKIPVLEEEIKEAKAAIEQDQLAANTKADQLIAEMDRLREVVANLTTEAELEKAKAQKLQQQRKRRRSDVYRIREELVEVKTDQFRAEQLQKQITDMIRRVQGNFIKLQTRHQQLKKSLQ